GTIPVTDTPAVAAMPCTDGTVSDLNSLRSNEKQEQKQKPHPVQPPNTAPPPIYQCPACDHPPHKHSYRIAEHIEKEHPELGQQFEVIHCPVDGCWFSTGWNRVGNTKPKADAALLEHHEREHNPNSPTYDPADECELCGLRWPRSHNHQCKKEKTHTN